MKKLVLVLFVFGSSLFLHGCYVNTNSGYYNPTYVSTGWGVSGVGWGGGGGRGWNNGWGGVGWRNHGGWGHQRGWGARHWR